MARFAHEAIEQQIASTLDALRSDQGRINYITAFLESNVDTTQDRIYRVFYLWTWLQQHAPETADQLESRLENLPHLVSSGRTVVSAIMAKVNGISSRWPEWKWDMAEHQPKAYSGNIVDSLVKLSRRIQGSEEDRRAAPRLLRQAVLDRLQARQSIPSRRSAAWELQTADVEKVWRNLGGQSRQEDTLERLLAQSSSALAFVPSPETGRPAGTTLRSESPSLFVSDAPGAESSAFQLVPAATPPAPLLSGDGLSPRPRPAAGSFAGQQSAATRPAKRQKRDRSPSPAPPPSPPPMPGAPAWANIFEAQRRHDEARVAAATTDDEMQAARASLNATLAYLAAMPPHFRGTQVSSDRLWVSQH